MLLSGKLVFGEAELSVDCAISDLSKSGARVRVVGAPILAEPIYLLDLRHGLAFKAREAWRRDALIGLAFHDYYDVTQSPPEAPKILRRLWVEHQNR